MRSKVKERLINALEKLKKEVETRKDVYKYGIDLANYENQYSVVALDLLVYDLFLMCKLSVYTEKEIKDMVEWWLYERIEKIITVKKKKYNVEQAKDFINFLLKH